MNVEGTRPFVCCLSCAMAKLACRKFDALERKNSIVELQLAAFDLLHASRVGHEDFTILGRFYPQSLAIRALFGATCAMVPAALKVYRDMRWWWDQSTKSTSKHHSSEGFPCAYTADPHIIWMAGCIAYREDQSHHQKTWIADKRDNCGSAYTTGTVLSLYRRGKPHHSPMRFPRLTFEIDINISMWPNTLKSKGWSWANLPCRIMYAN